MPIVRRLALTFFSLVFLLVAGTASAAPRDKAAQKKIEEAIYTHFLNTDFDAAEGLLLGTVRACEDKCSPAVIAKAWMYVGIIRGSGRNDIPGAQEAFSTALAADPAIQLDNEIATDPVKAAFAKVKGGGKAAAPAGAFTCAPSPSEIETRRPVPLSCESDKDITSARLIYKAFGTDWTTLRMDAKEGTFRATIPCGATQNTGKLVYYAQGLDADGAVVVSSGSKEQPNSADVVSESTADPPAFPSEEPPARCGVESMVDPPPPTGGECGAWGAACGKDNCCEGELACINGTCGEAECQSDSDCKEAGQECDAGRCKKDESGPYAKNVVGLHFGAEWMTLSSDGACTADSQSNDSYTCINPDTGKQVAGSALNPKAAGKIGGGFVIGTMRVMASYERIFGTISAEARLGFAFRGGPDFMPAHVEARLKYWILGEKAFSKPGFRPWVHVGGGFAQYDATVKPSVFDCSQSTDRAECMNFDPSRPADERPKKGEKVYEVEATKQLGLGFVTVGGGMMYAIGKNHGAVLNLNLTIPFASTGFVIAPSVGYAAGF